MAKLERWVAKSRKYRWKLRGMGGYVSSAPACYRSIAQGSNPDILQKSLIGDISIGVANIYSIARQENKKG